jgi:hypothetical protein
MGSNGGSSRACALNKPVTTCNTTHTEGEKTCISNIEYSYTCNSAKTWTTRLTGNSCGGGTGPGTGTGTGTGTPNNCSITPDDKAYCVQLFDASGNPTYTSAGITQNEYNTYYKNTIENSSYFKDGAIDTDHNIYGIAGVTPTNSCQPKVCLPNGPLTKTGCVNGSVPSCYTEGSIESSTLNLQLKISTSPENITKGGSCIVTWSAQDAELCNLVQAGTTIARSTHGQIVIQSIDQSTTVSLVCNPIGGGAQKSAQATCRVEGDFTEF